MPRINEQLELVGEGESAAYRCDCGYEIRPVTDNYKLHLMVREGPVQQAGPWVDPAQLGEDRFVCREFFCPGCMTLLDVEIAQKDEPILWDVRIAL